MILKFKKKGEKSGWSYIEVPADVAQKLKPGFKKSFRVKGKLDNFPISRVALLPMGDGGFIMPVNAGMRKGTGKRDGEMVRVQLQPDNSDFTFDKEFIDCMADDPKAFSFFKQLPKSHQHYFSKWIASAKADETKAKRIALSLNALSNGQGFPEMLRASKKIKFNYGK